MLLDLDQGSMTIYKNGDLLGAMVTEGLSGEYCWAVMLSTRNSCVRIDSVAMPVPPEPPASDAQLA
jgi:hypothetical protein